MPQTYLRQDLFERIARSYPDRKVVHVINEAVEEKLRRDGFLEEEE